MGPLHGIKIVEFAGLGPAPFCAMLLANMGAEVVRIDRPGQGPAAAIFDPAKDLLTRGRRLISLDLKHADGIATAQRLIAGADILLEGFRPGAMERLGLGPETSLEQNPKLIYGRMTGWGQDGPLAQSAGHDINYLALSGALHAIGRSDSGPVPPLNLVADFGGGAMFLAVGVLAALFEARQSGRGQIVDAAMTDGCALLMAMTYSMKTMGMWSNQRQSNLLDGAAHFYDTYPCADGKWLAVGPIEPHFYSLMLEKCGITDPAFTQQLDPALWPKLKTRLREVFAQKPRDVWAAIFADSDACVTPVLDLDEAPQNPHNQARQTFVERDGLLQPAPAPRFSRTVSELGKPPAAHNDRDTLTVLADWGFTPAEIAQLHANDIITSAPQKTSL